MCIIKNQLWHSTSNMMMIQLVYEHCVCSFRQWLSQSSKRDGSAFRIPERTYVPGRVIQFTWMSDSSSIKPYTLLCVWKIVEEWYLVQAIHLGPMHVVFPNTTFAHAYCHSTNNFSSLVILLWPVIGLNNWLYNVDMVLNCIIEM